jgi:hypothetical protein
MLRHSPRSARSGRHWVRAMLLVVIALMLAWGSPALGQLGPFTFPYEGFWQNITFLTRGDAHALLTVNGPAVTFTLDLDGNVLGGPDATPLTLTGTRNPPNLAVMFDPVSGHPTYGDVTASTDNTGRFTGQARNVPSPFIDSVDLTGQFGLELIHLDYTVYFEPRPGAGTAVGIIELVLVPEPGLMWLAAAWVWGALLRRRGRNSLPLRRGG